MGTPRNHRRVLLFFCFNLVFDESKKMMKFNPDAFKGRNLACWLKNYIQDLKQAHVN